ncbi:MAG: PVC-type heme-binding CxxCH protein [Chthoniobacteraceae bacterium]
MSAQNAKGGDMACLKVPLPPAAAGFTANRTMSPSHLFALSLALTPLGLAAPPTPPAPVDKSLHVQLVAMEPEIRTPTAIATDERGRIWVLENNSHFRPKDYDAPATDRVVIMEDFGPDGRARKFTTFAENFTDGMGLLLHGGECYIATRAEVFKARDTDGDDKADEGVTLLKLVTEDKYPHNGLSGLAVGRGEKGEPVLFVGFGENHGIPWKLTGSDGKELHGTDEGAIFRVNLDGSDVHWWALGVWNPFGLSFGKDGQLFALENDPGGGSLCRLVHIVAGGDYGYRYKYGRTIDHPFISWFGQIPGTLPPVCLVGEAPTGLMQVKGAALPGLQGELLGATWTENGIQRYPLTPKGVSFTSKPEWVVRGGHDFRPSGIAEAPDGSLVISDWADGSYDLHGKGRVWRLGPKRPTPQTDDHLVNTRIDYSMVDSPDDLVSDDPFIFRRGIQRLARGEAATLRELAKSKEPRQRLAALLAMRLKRAPADQALLDAWLTDADGAVRRAALQWIAEENLRDYAPKLEKALAGNPSRSTFQAYLAAEQMLLGQQPNQDGIHGKIVRVALDEQRPPELRALALRLAPIEHKDLTVAKLEELTKASDPRIQLEAARVLAARTDLDSQAVLRRIAADTARPNELRAEAAAGLVVTHKMPASAAILQTLASGTNEMIAREAKRSLGITTSPAEHESSEPAGDPAAGRRIFFHQFGPRCYTCHAVEGRGGTVGPDLTQLGSFTEEQLLEAIRNPSKDVAPAYTQWHLKLRDGREVLGIDQFEDNKSQLTLVDAAGAKAKYKFADLLSREPLDISLMPPGLDAALSPQELRDLIAYLRQPRD